MINPNERGDGFINLENEEDLLSAVSEMIEERPAPNGWDGTVEEVGVRIGDKPCLKCEFRNLQSSECSGPAADELYFSKAIAEALTKDKKPRIIPPRLLSFLIFQNDFTEEHVEHVSKVETPGIIAIGAIVKDGRPSIFAYLIDGTHRAVAAARANRRFCAFILTSKESMICAEQTMKELRAGNRVLVDPAPRK